MNKGITMNYRNDVLDLTRAYTAQAYNLPVGAYFLAQAVEEVAEYWFEGNFEFDCGMDAQDAVRDSTLAHLVMVKYYELELGVAHMGAGCSSYVDQVVGV